jgi:hypothetical protein
MGRPNPRNWVKKYKGQFAQARDKVREQTLGRQGSLESFRPIPNSPRKGEKLLDVSQVFLYEGKPIAAVRTAVNTAARKVGPENLTCI